MRAHSSYSKFKMAQILHIARPPKKSRFFTPAKSRDRWPQELPSLGLRSPIVERNYIQCSNCNKLIIHREICRRLGDRIRDHFYDIRKTDVSKPVFSRHFNFSNHFISNFVVFGLFVIKDGKDGCKTKEMRLIQTLGTLNPDRINERFTLN